MRSTYEGDGPRSRRAARQASSASSSPRPAACTGHRQARTSRRGRAARAAHRLRGIEGPRPSGAPPSSPDDVFSPVSMRNATAYGVSPRLRLDIVLNNLVGWALTTGAVRILSDGTPWRPLVHIEDMRRRGRRGPRGATSSASMARRSTSAASDANYQVRDLARSSPTRSPDVDVGSPGRGNRSAELPSRLREARRDAGRVPAGLGRAPRRADSSSTRIGRGMDAASSPATGSPGSRA